MANKVEDENGAERIELKLKETKAILEALNVAGLRFLPGAKTDTCIEQGWEFLVSRRERYDLYVHVKCKKPETCQLMIHLHHAADWEALVPEDLRMGFEFCYRTVRRPHYRVRRSSADTDAIVQVFKQLVEACESELQERREIYIQSLSHPARGGGMSQLTCEELQHRQELLATRYRELWPGLMEALRKIDPQGGWLESIDAFGGIGKPEAGSRCISRPFLLDMTAHNYCRASRRLFIVGKETADWETVRRIEGDPITYLLDIYRTFRLGADWNSVLLRDARRLYRLLNPLGPDDGFLWSNLNRVDENGGTPRPDVADAAFEHFNVLPEEIKLAKPDVVVFFTGPDLEKRLDMTFPGLQRKPVEGYKLRVLARLWLPPDREQILPFDTYRAYHPRYLKGHIGRVDRIASLCNAQS